ncbi:hypothetical protein [Rhodococcus qingshengii]|uniref:Uncharacterized protein n=1 Tax=Rhodococcus qingshengii TaxID=334542 RepID=A0A2A5JFW0_RHOSG|nr:hypothetical protein [Rhodococcus qingshengii]PCK27841.1 hypothetical protein CHR55_10175 [Rhodococcus qingshengii]
MSAELNERIKELEAKVAELEAALEYQKYGGRLLGDMFVKQSKDVVAAVGAEHMIDEDGDGDYGAVFELLFELRPARDAAIARYMAAEYTLARVHEVYENLCPGDDMTFVAYSDLTAALEGEQQ